MAPERTTLPLSLPARPPTGVNGVRQGGPGRPAPPAACERRCQRHRDSQLAPEDSGEVLRPGPPSPPSHAPKSPMPGHRGLFSRSRPNRDSPISRNPGRIGIGGKIPNIFPIPAAQSGIGKIPAIFPAKSGRDGAGVSGISGSAPRGPRLSDPDPALACRLSRHHEATMMAPAKKAARRCVRNWHTSYTVLTVESV